MTNKQLMIGAVLGAVLYFAAQAFGYAPGSKIEAGPLTLPGEWGAVVAALLGVASPKLWENLSPYLQKVRTAGPVTSSVEDLSRAYTVLLKALPEENEGSRASLDNCFKEALRNVSKKEVG